MKASLFCSYKSVDPQPCSLTKLPQLSLIFLAARSAESSKIHTRMNRQQHPSLRTRRTWLFVMAATLSAPLHAFVPVQRQSLRSPSVLTVHSDEEISRSVDRARALLEKTKAKLAAKKQAKAAPPASAPAATNLPYFASQEPPRAARRASVIKTQGENGFTTDGELMASLSEQEEWEIRAIAEVFERNELEDVYSMAGRQLAERDVAASLYNLRKTLRQEDYQKIFDKRNRFIGEDN